MDVGVGVSGFVKVQGTGANLGQGEKCAASCSSLGSLFHPANSLGSISAAPVRAEGRGQLEWAS